MKRIAAMILAFLMLLATAPAVAEGEDFVLEITGGPVKEHTETVNNQTCLKVELLLHGVSATKKLSALFFELNYDSTQLTYVRYQTAEALSATVNPNVPGRLAYAFASQSGVAVSDGAVMLTIWFKIADNLQNGTEIAFTLGSTEAESITSGKVAVCTVGSDFSPYIFGEVTELKDATVEWNASDVQFKGNTPYVIANGKAQTPRFRVLDRNGVVIDPAYYNAEYRENTQPGTGYVLITFKGAYSGTCSGSFKIYLPASAWLTAENTSTGIRLEWAPVEGAAGYVVYRRAWNSKSSGWTAFARWNNTTATNWVDGSDDSHKVYAGTRYQYGIKAYFARRTDPIAGVEIGGNANDNFGNWNLGLVSELKTTVRITTRTLRSVKPGTGELKVTWANSKVFTGYDVQVATDSAFKQNIETVRIADAAVYETTVKKLKSETTYYVRVRSYHVFEGMTYCGEWSNVLSARTN